MIRLVVLTGLLVFCSIWDIRTGMLPVMPLLVLALPGFLWRIASGSTFWWIFFSSLFPAAFLFLLSVVTKGFGKGDVLMIFAAGIWEGFETLLPALLYAFILAGGSGIVIAVFRKKSLRLRLPFAPFFALGTFLKLLISQV